jgi:hypothetical protein
MGYLFIYFWLFEFYSTLIDSHPGTTRQIFGGENMTWLKVAPMNGFVADAEVRSDNHSLRQFI